MGGGKSKSKSGQQFNWEEHLDPTQRQYLDQLWGGGSDLFNQLLPGVIGKIPGVEEGMQDVIDRSDPAWDRMLGGGAYEGINAGDIYKQIQEGMGPRQSEEQWLDEQIMGGRGNDYVDAMKQQMQSDSYDNLMKNLSGLDARAAASGMGGSSRAGLAQGEAIQGSQDALMDAQTRLGYETFDTDLQRKLDIARRADQGNLARYQTGTGSMLDMLRGQQGGMETGLGMAPGRQQLWMGGFAPGMMPWQHMNQWAGIIGDPLKMGSGSGSGSSKSKSKGMGK